MWSYVVNYVSKYYQISFTYETHFTLISAVVCTLGDKAAGNC